nr:hypothetical protein [Tanacetum cinerariifolium]
MKNKSIPQSRSSIGIFGIIRESFKTTSRNRKLLFPILLLTFLSYSQLELAQVYLRPPRLFEDFLLPLTINHNIDRFNRNIDSVTYNGAFKDIINVLLDRHFTLALSLIVKLIFFVATVSSSSEAYNGKVLGLKDFLLNIKRIWKKALITSFSLILTTFGIICIYMASYGITNFLEISFPWPSFVLERAITFSTPACYFYVLTLWMVSMVVSVLEEGCRGFKAIGRATQLMNGKWLQAILLMTLYLIAEGFVYHMAYFRLRYNHSRSRRLDTIIEIYIKNGAFCLLKMNIYVMFTVFYHDQKKGVNEKKAKVLHLPITTQEVS